MIYTRPEPNEVDKKEAVKTANDLLRKYGASKITMIISLLCLENSMLTREVNEHRAARDIEPLKVYEV